MFQSTPIPSWFGTAVVGAVFAALGYVAKAIHDWWKTRSADREMQINRLQELAVLLTASGNLFKFQVQQSLRLRELLNDNHPQESRQYSGYEEAFSNLYGQFTPQEKQLQVILRSVTENSVQQINQLLSEWLKNDLIFKTASVPIKDKTGLAYMLQQLELHLILWRAKYQVWIPGKPEHTLVFLADEESHGIGFPKGIESYVDQAIKDLQ